MIINHIRESERSFFYFIERYPFPLVIPNCIPHRMKVSFWHIVANDRLKNSTSITFKPGPTIERQRSVYWEIIMLVPGALSADHYEVGTQE
jgi:hypothetical protein